MKEPSAGLETGDTMSTDRNKRIASLSTNAYDSIAVSCATVGGSAAASSTPTEGRATRAEATYPAEKGVALGSAHAVSRESATGVASKTYRTLLAFAMLLAMVLAFSMSFAKPLPAFASTNTITTKVNNNTSNNTFSHVVTGAKQGTDGSTFASEGPVAAIYIDPDVVNDPKNAVLDLSSAATNMGFKAMTVAEVNAITANTLEWDKDGGNDAVWVMFDNTNAPNDFKLKTGQYNEFLGPLFTYTYPNAAILSDGTRADIVVSYSDVSIALQDNIVNGAWHPTSNPRGTDVGIAAIATANEIMATATGPGTSSQTRMGIQVGINIQVVDPKTGNAVEGAFIYPMTDIDVARRGSNTFINIYKAEDNFNYSESIRVDGGVVGDIYLPDVYGVEDRNSTTSTTNPPRTDGYKTEVVNERKAVRFIAANQGTPSAQGNPTGSNGNSDYTNGVFGSFYSGFVAFADNESGINLTGILGGGSGAKVRTYLLRGSKADGNPIYHRIKTSTSYGGNIQSTANGNLDGSLNDGGSLLDPGTVTVPDGKTVVYTMRADDGYTIQGMKLYDNQIGYSGTPIDLDPVSMSIGDVKPISIAGGQTGTMKRVSEDEFTFEFPSNFADHTLDVTWTPKPAVVNVLKIWDDLDNQFDTREDVTMHLDAMGVYVREGSRLVRRDFLDVLPAQDLAKTATGTGLLKTWGDGTSYTPSHSSGPVTMIDSIGSLPQTDDKGNNISYNFVFTSNGLRVQGVSIYYEATAYQDGNGTIYEQLPGVSPYVPYTDITPSGGPTTYRGADGTVFTQVTGFVHSTGAFVQDLPSQDSAGNALTVPASGHMRECKTIEHFVNNLPLLDADGNRITYIIRETLPDGSTVAEYDITDGLIGYTTKYDEDPMTTSTINGVAADTYNNNVENKLDFINEQERTELIVNKLWLDDTTPTHTALEIFESFKLFQNDNDITSDVYDAAQKESKLFATDRVITNKDNEVIYTKVTAYKQTAPTQGAYRLDLPKYRSADGQTLYYEDDTIPNDAVVIAYSLDQTTGEYSFTFTDQGGQTVTYSFEKNTDALQETADPANIIDTDPTASDSTLKWGAEYITVKETTTGDDQSWIYEVQGLPAYIKDVKTGDISSARYHVTEDDDFKDRYLEPSYTSIDKALDDGTVSNVEKIVVKATKQWEDDSNALGDRKDIVFHLDATVKAKSGNADVTGVIYDFLPPRKIEVNDGDTVDRIWGDDVEYTAFNPSDDPADAIKIYTTDTLAQEMDETTGEPKKFHWEITSEGIRYINVDDPDDVYIVNKLPRYDNLGNEIVYSIRETLGDGTSDVVADNPALGLVGYTSRTDAWGSFEKESDPASKLVTKSGNIYNTHTVTGTIGLNVVKHLEGRDYIGSDKYSFVLTAEDGTPMPLGLDSGAQVPSVPSATTGVSTVSAYDGATEPDASLPTGTVRLTADFDTIVITQDDLAATEVTYGAEDLTEAEKASVRFWTVGTGADEATYDMNNSDDVRDFNALSTADKNSAKGTVYKNSFTYFISEQPTDTIVDDANLETRPVTNDTSTQKVVVNALYNQVNSKILVSSVDTDEDDEFTTGQDATITSDHSTSDKIPVMVEMNPVYFTNVYDSEGTWTPEANKILTNRPLERDQFDFALTASKAVDEDTVVDNDTPEGWMSYTPMLHARNASGDLLYYAADGTPATLAAGGIETKPVKVTSDNATTIQDVENKDAKGEDILNTTDPSVGDIQQDVLKDDQAAATGANDLYGPVSFDQITFTKEDLKKRVSYGNASADQKLKVISWVSADGTILYGPIPGDAVAIIGVDGADPEPVTYANATDAQREAAQGYTERSQWTWTDTEGIYGEANKSYRVIATDIENGAVGYYEVLSFDRDTGNPVKSFVELDGTVLGTYYEDERIFTYYVWEKAPDDAEDTAGNSYADAIAAFLADETALPADTFSKDGFIYDTAIRPINVTIADNDDGTISVTPSVIADFANDYKAVGEVEISFTKKMDGRDEFGRETFTGEQAFTFEISAITNGAPLPQVTTNHNTTEHANNTTPDSGETEWVFYFDPIQFTHANLMDGSDYIAKRTADGLYERTFVYKITENTPDGYETEGTGQGVDPDDNKDMRNSILVAVTVQEDKAGNIKVVAINGADETELANAAFANQDIAIDSYTPGTWDFETQSMDMTTPAIAQNAISAGTLYNTYQANGTTQVEVSKTLEGSLELEDNMFWAELVLVDADGEEHVIDTKPNVNSKFTFDEIVYNLYQVRLDAEASPALCTGPDTENEADGTEEWVYTYKIRELIPGEDLIVPGVYYDDTEHEFTVTITDNGDGTLTATKAGADDLEFTNKAELMDIEVTKNWDDAALEALAAAGYDRPKSVAVTLTSSDGTEYGHGALDASNNWTYTFKNLPMKDANGADITYNVAEVAPEGYTVVYSVNSGAESATAPTVTHSDAQPASGSGGESGGTEGGEGEGGSASSSGGFDNPVVSVDVKNTPDVEDILASDIVIYKIDSITKEGIPGVQFTLTLPGNTTKNYTTNAYGVIHIKLDDLAAAGVDISADTKLNLEETSTPTGYEQNTDFYVFSVNNGKVDHVDLKPDGTIFDQIWDFIFDSDLTISDNAEYVNGILTVKNKPTKQDLTVTKTFTVQGGGTIPAALLNNFAIDYSYDSVATDGTADPQSGTLKVSGGAITPTVNGNTYTWTLPDVAYNSDVHVHETGYRNIAGYEFVNASVAGPGAIQPDDAHFKMPAASSTSGGQSGNGTEGENGTNSSGMSTMSTNDGGGVRADNPGSDNPGEGDVTVAFTNEYKKQTGDLVLVKEWDDASDQDGVRPANVTFTVTASAKPAETGWTEDGGSWTKDVTFGGSGDTWNDASLTGLYVYDDAGNLITYTVSEPTDPTNYTVQDSPSLVPSLTPDTATMADPITNKYTPKTGTITVTKTWDDNSNEAGMREEAIVYLFADGKLVGGQTGEKKFTGASDTETVTWDNVPVYDNGTKITYSVKESVPTGYTPDYTYAEGVLTDDGEGTFTGDLEITNKYEPAYDGLTVSKTWDDNNNQDGYRATSLIVTISAETAKGTPALVFEDGTESTMEVTLDETNNWTYTIAEADEELPSVYEGEWVYYSVSKEEFVGGDDSEYMSFIERTAPDQFTIYNIHELETANVEAIKVWEDSNNQDGKRPHSVNLYLKVFNPDDGTYSNAKDIHGEDIGGPIVVRDYESTDDTDQWMGAVWYNLPVKDAGGTLIQYAIVEDPVPDGYTYNNQANPFTLDNGDVLVFPENAYEASKPFDITVTKKWNDGNNQDGMRDDVELHLKGTIDGSAPIVALDFGTKTITKDTSAADDAPAGTATWTDLPEYHDGKKITYTVTEEALPGYSTTISPLTDEMIEDPETHEQVPSGNKTATVTNTRTPEVEKVSVTKVWDDANNQDGKRTDVSVTLKANGTTVTEDADGDLLTNPITLATGSNHDQVMTGTWDNLPAYANGQKITYTVEEAAITDYTTQISAGSYDEATKTQSFTITNTHEPETIHVDVEKTWANDTPAYRPDHVTFALKANGSAATDIYGNAVKPLTVIDDDSYTGSFDNLPKNANGTAIDYAIAELTVPGYTTGTPAKTTYSTGNVSISVENTGITGTLTVTKTWDDADDQDGKRTAAITAYENSLKVMADGKNVTSSLTKGTPTTTGNTTTITYTGVPIYDDGTLITYTVEEGTIPEYELEGTISETQLSESEGAWTGEVTLTNKHTPELVDIKINKVWDDEAYFESPATDAGVDNQYARPNLTFTVAGEAAGSQVSSDDHTMTAATGVYEQDITVEDLPAYDGGNPITYTVTEQAVEGFETTVTSPLAKNEQGVLETTITNTPIDEEEYTPTTITLKKIDAKTGNPIVKDDANKQAVFTITGPDGSTVDATLGIGGTLPYNFDKPGDYTITEKTAPEGYVKSDDSFTVTVDKELTKIELKSNDNWWEWLYDLITGSSNTSWDDENKILTVSNEPEMATFTVEKQWADSHNQDTTRVADIPFTLQENGQASTRTDKTQTMTGISATAADNTAAGTITWELPIYRDGAKVKYSVTEDTVPTGYTESYSDNSQGIELTTEGGKVVVTNSYTPKTIKIKVNKSWVDEDPSTRGTADLKLYKTVDGAISETTFTGTVTPASDGQVVEWTVPVNENGHPITYRVEEGIMAGYTASYETSYATSEGTHQASDANVEAGDVVDEATVTVINTKPVTVTVTKTWVDGANTNVDFQLYRTTEETPSAIADGWQDDGTWELVPGATHTFLASSFNVSAATDTKDYTFTDLPKQAPDGKAYTYRVLETTAGGDRFSTQQTGDLAVTNTNTRAGEGIANVNVVKELAGRNWKSGDDGDKFYFAITPDADHHGGTATTDKPITASEVPMPGGTNKGEMDVEYASTQTNSVGAIGRVVAFNPVTYAAEDVPQGETKEFYYTIYEVTDDTGATKVPEKDDQGITYDGTGTGASFEGKVAKAKVVVTNNDGTISTDVSWFNGTDYVQGAVPVFTNTYDAVAEVSGYIVKHIGGRNFEDSDTFDFKVINVAGSIVRTDPSRDAITQMTAPITVATIDSSSANVAGVGDYDPASEVGADKATKTNINTFIKVSDLPQPASGPATGTFIYEFTEDEPASGAVVDLIYDTHRVYIKVVVTDNQDGTMKVEPSYWYDAACTMPAPTARVLINTATGDLAEVGKTAQDEGYAYINAASFTNEAKIKIEVVKKWVDKSGNAVDPTDDVTVNVRRFAVNPGTTPSSDNLEDWTPVGTHVFERSAFTNGEATYTFNDLPLLEHNAQGALTGKEYVYRICEATGSEAYSKMFQVNDGTQSPSWTTTSLSEDGKVTITNTLEATNTANITAVKQLMNREWLDTLADGTEVDRYTFQLTPVGMAVYDAAGEFESVDESDEAKAKVPMPESVVSSELDPTDTDKALAAKTTKFVDTSKTDTEEVVGVGERLARFGGITYDMTDLVYDPTDDHMQGDFYYTMKEVIPAGATNADGDTYGTDGAQGPWTYQGVTYDDTEHTVHVKVRENRTGTLTVQVAYDYDNAADIASGTQFTPVFTNTYDSEGMRDAAIDKYIMGRDWVEDETFTFTAQPLGNAPFFDENGDPLGDSTDVVLTVSGTDARQTVILPPLSFQVSDLPWTVGANGAKDARDTIGTSPVKYSDGTPAIEGLKYGRFVYAISETASSATDLNKDADTEYIRVSVIDKGDGTLDTIYKVYEDRYCTTERKDPQDPTQDATAATFVNQLKRNLSVTKAWTSPATDDVVLRLQWSTDNSTWNNVEGTAWLAGVDGTKTIAQEATGGELTVEWENLPAYANTQSDIYNLNDQWVYYRVVEDAIADVDTRYSIEAWDGQKTKDDADYSADPIATEAEKVDSEGEQVYPDERTTQTFVINFPQDLEGDANIHVVKQLIGRGWTPEDSFAFSIERKESKKGGEADFTPYDPEDPDRTFPMPAKTEGGTTTPTDTATATTSSEKVSVNEYNATFDPITIKLSDLAVDPADGVAKGWFKYTITEKIPDDAVEITQDGETYRVYDNIKYTTKTEEVTVYAQNNGNGVVSTTVQFGDRPVGDFVPVYTNEALVITPIQGTKTWVGGEEAEHVNADDQGADKLGIKIYRKTVADAEAELTEDDAGRPLKIVWSANEGDGSTGNATYSIKAVTTVDDGSGTPVEQLVEPVLDTVGPKGNDYIYRIAETAVPDNYTASYTTTTLTDDTITNTSAKTDSLKVTKTWDDADNAEGLRPGKVVMHLYKQVDGSEVQVEVAKQEIAAGSETTGITWNELPVYDDAGNKITYVVIEESEYGYTTTYKAPGAADYTAAGNTIQLDGNTTADVQVIDVKNELVPETTKVLVTKEWDDNNNIDGKRPENGVEFTLYERVWDPNKDNGDGQPKGGWGDERPATKADNRTAIDKLTLDGTADEGTADVKETTPADANTWKGEFGGLAATKGGKTVIYYVKETTDLTTDTYKYKAAVVTGNQLDGFKVTNTRAQDLTQATITKTWSDDNNKAGMRPETLTVELWRTYKNAGNEDVYEKVTTDADGNTIKHLISADDKDSADNTGNTWTTTIKNLPANILLDKEVDGEITKVASPITYYWKELVPESYKATVTGDVPTTDADAAKPEGAGDTTQVQKAANGQTITNTLTTFKLNVMKGWADGNNRENLRPLAVQTLMSVSGTTSSDPETASDDEWFDVGFALVDDCNGLDDRVSIRSWNTLETMLGDVIDENGFITLPAYKDGKLIHYYFEERAINGYTTTYRPTYADTASSEPVYFDYESNVSNYEAAGSSLTHGDIYIVVVNKHDPNFSITKKWDDANADVTRPSADEYKSSLKLWATGPFGQDGALQTKDVTADYADKLSVTDNDDDTYTVTWTELPQYEDGEPGPWEANRIIYHVTETKVDGYDDPAYTNVDDPATSEVSLYCLNPDESTATDKAYDHGTITNTVGLKDVYVRIGWNGDGYDAPGDGTDNPGNATLERRPANVPVTLQYNAGTEEEPDWQPVLKNDQPVKATLSADNNWAAEFKNLPAFDGEGTPIQYRVINDTTPDGYTVSTYNPTSTSLSGSVIIFTYGITELTGTKTWIDGGKTHDNAAEISLVVTATKGEGDDAVTTTLTEGTDYHVDWNGNTYTVRGLQNDGSTYAVAETLKGAAEGKYNSAQDGNNFTNTIKQEKVYVKATKKWVGENEEAVTVKLLADGVAVADSDKTLEANGSSVTWDELDKYALGGDGAAGDGHEIVYTIEEVQGASSASYNASISGPSGAGTQADPFAFEITNSFDETDIPVTIVWNDSNDQDKLRPATTTVRLLDAEGNPVKDIYGNDVADLVIGPDSNWTSAFKNVPRTDSAGNPIQYQVVELDENGDPLNVGDTFINDEYTLDSVTGDASTGFTVTNSHGTGVVTIKATKKWVDDGNDGSTVHTDVILHLYGLDENGLVVYDGATKKIEKDATGEDGIAKWTGLPKRHYSDVDLTWKVVEEAVPGYITSYSTEAAADGDTIEVTNTYVGPTTTVVATKEWQDGNGRDGKRPESVTFNLMQKIGDGEPSVKDSKTIEGPVKGEWTAKAEWKDLPVTSNEETGETENKDRIEYQEVTVYVDAEGNTIEQADYDALPEKGQDAYAQQTITTYVDGEGNEITAEEYDALDDDAKTAYTPQDTISYTDGTKSIDHDAYEALPAKGKSAYEQTTEQRPETITEEVPETEEQAVIYWVEEEYDDTVLKTNGYAEPIVTATGPGEYKVINARALDTVDVKVIKIWDDGGNVDGKRPDHVAYTLSGGGVEASGILAGDNDWTATHAGLLKRDAEGAIIEYAVEEGEVTDYEPTITSAVSEDGKTTTFTIKNTYNPANTLTLRATKTWVEEDGEPVRSDVILHLIQIIDGAEKDVSETYGGTKTIAADAEAGTEVEWTTLPALVGGKSATYSVEEEAVDGYTTSYNVGEVVDNVINVEVTNTKDAIKRITVTYVEPDTFDNEVIQGPDTIKSGEPEPDAPSDPSHEGYTFTGWQRSVDADGNVTYTARYAEIPAPEPEKKKVTYIDPKAADGSMILSAKLYDGQDAADAAANGKTDAPDAPSHDGLEFAGWALNQDEFGDWVLVAKYNEKVTPDNRKVVSYIDPQTGELIISEITDDISSIKPPNNPSHDGFTFLGWEEVVDANGNHVFVAKYAPDCANNPTPADPEVIERKTPAPSTAYKPAPAVTPQAVGKMLAKTGDEAPIAALGFILILATATVTLARRRS